MEPLPYNVTDDDKDFARLLKDKKSEFLTTFAQNLNLQERNLQVFRASIEHCKDNNLPKSKIIWNAAGYISLISFDLKIVVKCMTFAELEWEKRYFARQAALLMYEGTQDLFVLFGKSFRRIVDELPDAHEIRAELSELTKRLNAYKVTYSTKLNEIRNYSIAHRDNEVLSQLKVICAISWVDTIHCSSAFDSILNDTGRFMQLLLNTAYFDN